MKYAVVIDDTVKNVIIAAESQKEEFEVALGATLEDATGYGLCPGDTWNGTAWTRNIDGEQVVLDALTAEQQTDFSTLAKAKAAAEAKYAADMAVIANLFDDDLWAELPDEIKAYFEEYRTETEDAGE